MKWHNLDMLWLLPPLLWFFVMAFRDRWQGRGILHSLVRTVAAGRPTVAARLRHLPWLLRVFALLCVVGALIRPQTLMGDDEVRLKGVNIMLVTDLSGSMVAEDLKPDRLRAEKKVLTDFVKRIRQDNVGLVVFGSKSFTQSPLTMDYTVLTAAIASLDLNTVDADGTAIGDGIITAVNRLAEFDGQTNVIVLATDGTNNQGEDPLKAAEIAEAKRIRIYTIGIGAQGGAPITTVDSFGAKQPYIVNGQPMRWEEPNDALMTNISAKTGGQYFRATDEKTLGEVYLKIDRLIKDEKKRRDPHYQERFPELILLAMAALVLDALLSALWLRSLA